MGDGVKDDDEALREIASREGAFDQPCVTNTMVAMRKAHALGRASGWQAAHAKIIEDALLLAWDNMAFVKRRETELYPALQWVRRLVTDDQRASVSGGCKCGYATHLHDGTGLVTGGCLQQFDEHDQPIASVSGERDRERKVRFDDGQVGCNGCHKLTFEYVNVNLCPKCSVPLFVRGTDRNAGRDAAAPDVFQLTREQVVTLSGILTSRRDDFLRNGLPLFSAEPGLLDDMRDWLRCHPAVEAALKGGGE